MNIVRKRILALCAGLLLAGPLRAESVTVAIWGSGPAEVAAFDQAAAAFTRASGITVKKQVIEDKYMDVLKSRFAGRQPPDVFYLDAYEAPLLIASGVLEPFTADPADEADFYPQFLDAFRGADGKLYGLPKDYSTLALYVNPVLLRKAGKDPARLPSSFDELMRYARALQPHLQPGVGAMIIEKDLARHMSAMEAYGRPVVATGGKAQLSGNPGVLAYLNELVSGHAAHYLFSPKDDLGADWPGAAFGTGKTAMMMEGNWVQAALKHDYANQAFTVREMPTVNGRKQTMAFVVGYAVARDARNKPAALKFARFMTGPGLPLWIQASGNLPPRRSLEASMQLATDPAMRAHIAGAAYATVWSRGDALPIMNFNFGAQFLAAFNGTKPLAAALAKAETVSNREIERQR